MYVYALQCVRRLGVFASLLLLVACSNGRGSVDAEPPAGARQEAFTVGGTISGLAGGGLVLQLNGGSDLAPITNGHFAFSSALADGAAYSVTVLSQPAAPAQSCTVANATGSIAGANVTNVAVTCTTGAFAIRGAVTGLVGSGLVLQNNGGDDLAIAADGAFGFATPVLAGDDYRVTVLTQPSTPSQSCTVTNESGTVGSADVTDIAVTCATGNFTIGGTVTGLAGAGLVLQNNGGDALTVNGNGTFTFATPLASGATYNVAVRTHPTNPNQSCTVANGSGRVASGNVTDVAVACATNRFTIGGTVSGYTGTGLVLRLNNGDDLRVDMSGPFAFATSLPSGAGYTVRVRTQPSHPTQECTVTNELGTVGSTNVTHVAVACVTRSFSIGGSVSGLAGSGLVLQLNDGNDLAIASDGAFTFAGQHLSGAQYTVTVRTPPSDPAQVCTIENASGTVGGGDVRNVRVRCATSVFSVGGAVSGLLGSGLVLQNNGGSDLPVPADGPFTFTEEVASGSDYLVTVRTQPSDPTQACGVENGSGEVGNADVTNVVVTCSTSNFTIGGSVSGLAGSGLRLLNNGADPLDIQSDGGFAFQTPLPSGATYDVSVGTQPAGPTQQCVVTNGQGTVGGGNVENVAVACTTTQQFMVRVTVAGLSGGGSVVLQNNGGDTLQIGSDGTFAFASSLQTGMPYDVTVLTQPANQTCTVTNGAGTVAGADVSVTVDCADDPPAE